MPRDDLWTRDQLLLALRLYMRVPFGRLYHSNPEIIRLAQQIGRSANALAMKASNFASLDPALQARGIRGLPNLSNADRAIWAEFANNTEALAAEAEEAAGRVGTTDAMPNEAADVQPPEGPTETERVIRARRVRWFFRAAVLTTYDGRCAISGMATAELLSASHIIPWRASVERRADPRNGICLNALFDRAFDRGLFTFDDNFRVVVSRSLPERIADARLTCSLDRLEGEQLRLPERFPPDLDAVRYHRRHVFQAG